MQRQDLRSVPRYFLNPSQPGIANGRVVRLIDLSIKGARLELNHKLESGQKVVLTFPHENEETTVTATVLWCQLDSLHLDSRQDAYLAGVAFETRNFAVDGLIGSLDKRGMAMRIEDNRQHDRYVISSPITASFGNIAPVSVVDLSVKGARIHADTKLIAGSSGNLRFQIDSETGLIDVMGTVMWARPTVVPGQMTAGLLINDEKDMLRQAIHRLCLRGEARIDLDSLRRKFDGLRVQMASGLLQARDCA